MTNSLPCPILSVILGLMNVDNLPGCSILCLSVAACVCLPVSRPGLIFLHTHCIPYKMEACGQCVFLSVSRCQFQKMSYWMIVSTGYAWNRHIYRDTTVSTGDHPRLGGWVTRSAGVPFGVVKCFIIDQDVGYASIWMLPSHWVAQFQSVNYTSRVYLHTAVKTSKWKLTNKAYHLSKNSWCFINLSVLLWARWSARHEIQWEESWSRNQQDPAGKRSQLHHGCVQTEKGPQPNS